MGRVGFGKFIKSRREELELNQSQLARLVGVQQQQVSKWEKGATLPDSVRLALLADALQLQVDDLYRAHAAASEQENRTARRELSQTLETVQRFVDQYQELGHTYRRLDETMARLLEVCEGMAAQQNEVLRILRTRAKD